MPQCPEYRLRLFLSVDLVGSTIYKARFSETNDQNGPHPTWVTQIRHFYREFPKFVLSRFEKALSINEKHDHYRNFVPAVWKTIGDEIILCVRVHSIEHLSYCVTAFIKALEDYGGYLDGEGKHLDVKGAGWIAAFPAPNVSVGIVGIPSPGNSDILDELLETRADKAPAEFDFLGKEIDSGFRSARHASSDRFTTSVELAWLLAEAAHSEIFSAKFSYHGRQVLKGVLNDRPYPIISLDAERSHIRREVRTRERAVMHSSEAVPLHLRDFLKSFMDDENIDPPLLKKEGEELKQSELPKCYMDFRSAWEMGAKENYERSAEEVASEAEDGTQAEMPSEIGAALDATIANVESEKNASSN